MLIYQKKIESIYEKDIWDILYKSEKEFIPPLFTRDSTTQKDLINIEENNEASSYYQQMLNQEFIIAIEQEKVIGFLTFIPNYFLQFEDQGYKCDYVTTIIVSANHRGKGFARKMYSAFFEARKGNNFATRTWSTNYSHLRLLKELHFDLIMLLPNDRGIGIDTVYYFKGDFDLNAK